jgi:hypothetical protein
VVLLGSLGAAAAVAAEPDARAALVEAGQAFSAAPAYRAVMKQYAADGALEHETLTEFQAPDRLRIVEPGRETVVYGERCYVREPLGRWREASPSSLVGRLKNRAQHAEALLEGKTGFAYLRRERLGGVWTRVYRYRTKPGATPASTTTLGVAESDGLPRQEEFVLVRGDGTTSKRVTTFEYPADVRIERPTP